MESKIQYHVDKFVAFLFGKENENDPEQIIYNRFLHLEGDELEVWMNEKLKKYITGKGYPFEFEGFARPFRFVTWYDIHSLKENSDLMFYQEIYDRSDPNYTRDIQNIILKLHDFQKQNSRNYEYDLHWRIHILTDYMEMFIMTMTSNDLKSYIIQQVTG